MPYLTMRKNLKLQLSPGLVSSYDIQPGNGVGLFWDTKHAHIYLLSPDPHGERWWKNVSWCAGSLDSFWSCWYVTMRSLDHRFRSMWKSSSGTSWILTFTRFCLTDARHSLTSSLMHLARWCDGLVLAVSLLSVWTLVNRCRISIWFIWQCWSRLCMLNTCYISYLVTELFIQ